MEATGRTNATGQQKSTYNAVADDEAAGIVGFFWQHRSASSKRRGGGPWRYRAAQADLAILQTSVGQAGGGVGCSMWYMARFHFGVPCRRA
jgi:hypothetical protein